MSQHFRKYVSVAKVDEATHTVAGIAASELPDRDGEIWDYAYGKAAMQKWSNQILARTVGSGAEPSLGNIRIMHGLEVGGKVTKLEFKDDVKQAWIETQPVNEEVWQQLKRGILNSFSIGGGYAWKKKDGDYQRYGADVSEISYVDNPANPDAVFTFVRADGSMELRKFAPRDPNKVITDAAELAKATAEEFAAQVEKTRIPSGKFSVQNSGETHDFLVNSGYTHERTGESKQHGVGVTFPLAVYQNDKQSITVHSNGYWEHNNGHQVHTTGSGLQDLKAHLEACMAAKDEMNKGGEPMSQEQLSNIESMLKRFKLPFTAEHLERASRGEMTVEEEEGLTEEMEKSVKYLVPDGNHLPYTDESGNISHRLLGAAWAALHGGYRGNKYEGPDKEKALAQLKHLYESEGLDTPSEKATKGDGMTPEQAKEFEDSMIDPEDRIGLEAEDEDDDNDADDDEEESAEAEALGSNTKVLVTPAAKTAVNSNTEGDDSMKHVEELVKAAKGLASHFKAAEAHHLKKADHHEEAAATHEQMAECHKAAHGHHKALTANDLSKGMATHHSEMHKLHKAMAAHHTALHKMHKAFGGHCGKMAVGCEDGAEKATKAAEQDQADLNKSVADLGVAVATGIEEVKKGFNFDAVKTEISGLGDLVKAKVAEALKDLPAPDGSPIVKATGLGLVPRPGEAIKTQTTEGVSEGDAGL